MFDGLWQAFFVGGSICIIAQLAMELTPFQITPAHVLVSYVTCGAFLSAIGLYQPLVDFAGAGATVPLSGFGHLLAQGAIEKVAQDGLIGAFTGGLSSAALGITAAIILGFTTAMLFNPKG